ncbi:hypothetical protein PBI_SCTP2_105 [Salicola phage SCTP-2]|nr:hypothetical protein PBI_SCTP2_105 [Salicola phage SCTP-2]
MSIKLQYTGQNNMSNDNTSLIFRDEHYENGFNAEKTFHLYIVLPCMNIMNFYDYNANLMSYEDIDNQTREIMASYKISNFNEAQPWAKEVIKNFNYNDKVIKDNPFGLNKALNEPYEFFYYSDIHNANEHYCIDSSNKQVCLKKSIFDDLYFIRDKNNFVRRFNDIKYDTHVDKLYNSIFLPLFVETNQIFFNKCIQNKLKKYNAEYYGTNIDLIESSFTIRKFLNDKERFSFKRIKNILPQIKQLYPFILSRNSSEKYNIVEFSFDSKKKMLSFEKFLEKEFDLYNVIRYLNNDLDKNAMNLKDYILHYVFSQDKFEINNNSYLGAVSMTGCHQSTNPSFLKLSQIQQMFSKFTYNHSNAETIKTVFFSFLKTSYGNCDIVILFKSPTNRDEYEKIYNLYLKKYIKPLGNVAMKLPKNANDKTYYELEMFPFVVDNHNVFNRIKIDDNLYSLMGQIHVNTDNIDEIYEKYINQ